MPCCCCTGLQKKVVSLVCPIFNYFAIFSIRFQHTEILKRLFVIYFRILKLGFKSDLLGITLRGLARFSHLINIDFFGDLMNCLETILKYEVRRKLSLVSGIKYH